jgi:site-specific recombinase XerD
MLLYLRKRDIMAERRAEHAEIDGWLTELQKSGKSIHTCQGYARALSHFCGWWAVTYQEPFTSALVEPQTLQLWKRHQLEVEGAKPATVNLRLVAASRFLKWALKQGMITEDPSDAVTALPLPEPQPRGLDRTVIERLRRQALKEGDPRNVALLEVLLGTGMRISEVLALQREDIVLNEDEGMAIVRDQVGEELRRVPLNRRVRQALRAYLQEEGSLSSQAPLWAGQRGALKDRTGVFRILKQWAWKAGLKEASVSPRIIRHTFAARYLAANPGDLRGLAHILGNSSLASVSGYAPAPDNLAERMERLELEHCGIEES